MALIYIVEDDENIRRMEISRRNGGQGRNVREKNVEQPTAHGRLAV